MGQIASSSNTSNANSPSHRIGSGSGSDRLLTDVVDALGHEIRKQANAITELSTLSYDEFLQSLTELNAL